MMARSSHCVRVRSICWQSVKANGQVAVVIVIIMVVVAVVVVVAAACKQVSSASAAHESQKTQSEASLGGNTKLKLAKKYARNTKLRHCLRLRLRLGAKCLSINPSKCGRRAGATSAYNKN